MPGAIDSVAERQQVRAFAVFFALLAVFMFGAGIRQLVFTLSGPAATATVTHCEPYLNANTIDIHCVGTWTVGGRAVTGTIVGVDYPDVGKTISVHVHQDAAYSPSLLPPIMLLVLGVFLTGVTVYAFRRSAKTARSQ